MRTGMLLIAMAAPSVLTAQDSENCRFEIINVDRQGRRDSTATGINYYAGGNVVLGCAGRPIRMKSDSIASYGGGLGIVQFIGDVTYQDSTIIMTADNGTYYRQGERWEARGNVVTRNLETGSTIKGPMLDYYRILKGTRDTAELYAEGRPVIHYIPVDSLGGAEEAYVIVADRVRMKGNDRIWTAGRTTINRSDFAATADSMRLDTGAGQDGTLIGNPVMRGFGADTFDLRGNRIDLTLSHQDLDFVVASGNAHAVGTDLDLTADTIALDIEQEELIQTLAWGRIDRPHAISAEYEIRADSLALDTPEGHLKQARAFGDAWVAGAVDSISRERDQLTGDTVIADFARSDSATTDTTSSGTVLERVDARSSATALYRTGEPEEDGSQGISYSRADRIVILMEISGEAGVKIVRLIGNVDGIQLDPVTDPVPPDSLQSEATDGEEADP